MLFSLKSQTLKIPFTVGSFYFPLAKRNAMMLNISHKHVKQTIAQPFQFLFFVIIIIIINIINIVPILFNINCRSHCLVVIVRQDIDAFFIHGIGINYFANIHTLFTAKWIRPLSILQAEDSSFSCRYVTTRTVAVFHSDGIAFKYPFDV